MYISAIHGLVTRDSCSERRKNLDQLGFVNARESGRTPLFMRPPSLKPTDLGFLLSAGTPQSGLANGPEWAALKIHRAPTVGDCRRGAIPVTVAGWFNSGAWGRLKAARPDTAQVNLPPSTSFRNGVGGGFAVNLNKGLVWG